MVNDKMQILADTTPFPKSAQWGAFKLLGQDPMRLTQKHVPTFFSGSTLSHPPSPAASRISSSRKASMSLGDLCDCIVLRVHGGHGLKLKLQQGHRWLAAYFHCILNTPIHC